MCRRRPFSTCASRPCRGSSARSCKNEYDELEKRIAYLPRAAGRPRKGLRPCCETSCIAIRDKYGDERNTEIQDIEDDIDIEDLIEEEQCVFTLSHGGYIKRVPVDEHYRASSAAAGA